jgi:TRAP-type C4-dicarboxylate transport system substrate-binding protein
MPSLRPGRLYTIGLALLAALGFGLSEPRAAEKLVYATFFSDVYAGSKTDIWFMEEVEKRSGGEIKFERYWANSLMKATDLLPSLKSGAADIVNSAPVSYNGKEYPLAAVMMPFITTRSDAVMKAYMDLYKNNAAFRNEYESKGVKVLYAFAWAENTLWSRKPVAKLADLKGLKVRAPPPISDAILKLGGTPVGIAWTEGIEALQRGVVDAFSSAPFDSAVHGNMQDVAKHGTDLGGSGIFAVTVIGISLQRYNTLSEKHRKIIDEVSAEMPVKAAHFNEVSINSAVDKLCAMKEKLTISKLDEADRAQVKKLVADTIQGEWIARVAKETKADGKALLDEFISYIRKYEPSSTYVPGFERYEKKCGS